MRKYDVHEEELLGEKLIRAGLVRFEQIHECLELQRSGGPSAPRLGEILVQKGYLSASDLDRVLRQGLPSGPVPYLPGFEVLEPISRGSMGVVYRGIQKSVGRPVAIKVLSPDLASNRVYIERFLRETRIAARLSHPNIVRAIDAGSEGGVYFLVMELVDGSDGLTVLRRKLRLAEGECRDVARAVGSALSHAARHGLVHRDIKPRNILFARDGTIKLCDLGLGKRLQDPGITDEGIAMGTPLYLAPEVARGREADIRSDLYSLGATLYHFATGTPPFLAATPQELLRKHLTEPPVPPRQLVRELSEGFELLLLRLLAKDPAERYQTPAEVVKAVEALSRPPQPGAARSPTAFRRPGFTRRTTVTVRLRRRHSSAGILVALAALALALLFALYRAL